MDRRTDLGKSSPKDSGRTLTFKPAERVEVSVRRMRVRLSESSPSRALFAHVWSQLRALLG